MSFLAHFALTIAANGSGSITVSVCVVGFLMPIDHWGELIDKSAIPKLFLN
jgi:hypothetical protein